MALYTTISDNQYVGDTLPIINNNYANIDTQLTTNINNTNFVYDDVIKKGTTVSNVSTFLYGTNLHNRTLRVGKHKNPYIVNKWSDVYINPSKDPLRVSFTNDAHTRRVFLQGKLYIRHIGMPVTSFYRIARFDINTSVTPLDVIDITTCQGVVNHSFAYNTILQGFYTLQPNTTYTFGLQHWWPSTGAQPGGGIQINGWQTKRKNSWKENTSVSYKYIYANDVTIGYPNTGVNIESYLKLTVI